MPAVEERVCPDLTSVTRAAADAFVRQVDMSYRQRGTCYLALTGGPAAERLYRLLTQTRRGDVAWDACHVFLTDERVVAVDDASSNADMLARHLAGTGATVHRVAVEASDPQTAADVYESRIRSVVPGGFDGVPVFDLMVLAMGRDGQVASLFPGMPSLDERHRLVVAAEPGGTPPPVHRVTCTLPLINRARSALMMTTDAGCNAAYLEVRSGFPRPPAGARTPAGRVRLEQGSLLWFVESGTARRQAQYR